MSNTLIIVTILIAIFLAMGMILFLRQRSTAGGCATTGRGGWGFTLPTMSPMTWKFLAAFTTFIVVNAIVAVLLPSIGRVIGAQGGEFTAWMEILLFVFLLIVWMGDHSRVTTQWGLGILFVVLVGGIIISATSAHTNARRAEAVATREVAREVGPEFWLQNGSGRYPVRVVTKDGENLVMEQYEQGGGKYKAVYTAKWEATEGGYAGTWTSQEIPVRSGEFVVRFAADGSAVGQVTDHGEGGSTSFSLVK